jgi:hypothetical protein
MEFMGSNPNKPSPAKQQFQQMMKARQPQFTSKSAQQAKGPQQNQ